MNHALPLTHNSSPFFTHPLFAVHERTCQYHERSTLPRPWQKPTLLRRGAGRPFHQDYPASLRLGECVAIEYVFAKNIYSLQNNSLMCRTICSSLYCKEQL